MWHWLSHALGMDNGSGPIYLAWSGWGGDIAEIAVIGAAWKILNCHEDGCWRVGTKVTMEPNGHHYRRCVRCHRARHT